MSKRDPWIGPNFGQGGLGPDDWSRGGSGQSDRIPGEYADCPLCGETIYNSGAAWGGHMFVTHEYRPAPPEGTDTRIRNEPPLDARGLLEAWGESQVDERAEPLRPAPPAGQSDRIPRTEAGRETLADPYYAPPSTPFYDRLRDRIVAIEDEASAAPPEPPLTYKQVEASLDAARYEHHIGGSGIHVGRLTEELNTRLGGAAPERLP